MSDTSQGPGWWQASDGKWYPPETHPQYAPSTLDIPGDMDESGELIAGDGVLMPLLEYQASRFRGGPDVHAERRAYLGRPGRGV